MAVACASLGRVSSKLPLAAKGALPGQDPVYGTYASTLLISWSRMNSRLRAERGTSYGSQSCVDCPWTYKPGSRRRVGPEPRLEGQPCGCPVLKCCRTETWDECQSSTCNAWKKGRGSRSKVGRARPLPPHTTSPVWGLSLIGSS